MKNAVRASAPYANSLSWTALAMALDERFHWSLTRTELAFIALGAAAVFHAAIKYGRPIAAALYRRVLKRVGADEIRSP